MQDVFEPNSCRYSLQLLSGRTILVIYDGDVYYTLIGGELSEWVLDDLARRLGASVKEE